MGLISKTFTWFAHPFNDKSTPVEWLAGLVLLLIVAFMWSTVVKLAVD